MAAPFESPVEYTLPRLMFAMPAMYCAMAFMRPTSSSFASYAAPNAMSPFHELM
jgi:hypothetical protein